MRCLIPAILLAAFSAASPAGEPPERIGLPIYSYEKCLDPAHHVIRLFHGRQAEAWAATFASDFSQDACGQPLAYSDPRPVEIVHYPLRFAQTGYRSHTPAIDRLAVAADGRVYVRLVHASLPVRNSQPWLLTTCFHFSPGPEVAGRLLAYCRDLTLRCVISGRIPGFRSARAHHGKPSLMPQWEAPEIRFLRIREPILKAEPEFLLELPVLPAAETAETPPEVKEENNRNVTSWTPPVSAMTRSQAVRRVLYAADAEGLVAVGGYWPEAQGFYARDAPPTIYDAGEMMDCRRVAVLEHDDAPAQITLALKPALPPGRYLVMFSTLYFRSRFFDNILHISLADQTREVAFSFPLGPGEGRIWMRASAIEIDRPADRLVVKCLQIGTGGRAAAPDYPKRALLLDRFFITNVMEDWDADNLALLADDPRAEPELRP